MKLLRLFLVVGALPSVLFAAGLPDLAALATQEAIETFASEELVTILMAAGIVASGYAFLITRSTTALILPLPLIMLPVFARLFGDTEGGEASNNTALQVDPEVVEAVATEPDAWTNPLIFITIFLATILSYYFFVYKPKVELDRIYDQAMRDARRRRILGRATTEATTEPVSIETLTASDAGATGRTTAVESPTELQGTPGVEPSDLARNKRRVVVD